MMRRMYVLIVALVISLVPVMAQDVSKQESRKAKLQREIELLDQQLEQNASKSSALLSNLELLKKNIENRKALVKESDKEIRRYADSVYLKQLAINRLKADGYTTIRLMCLVASPQGVKAVQEAHPDVDLYLASLDKDMNAKNYILPGLGDAGDRIFGTL